MTDQVFWLQGHVDSSIVVGIHDTSATLTIVCLKAARKSEVNARQDYPGVTVCVGDGRTTKTIGMVICIIHLASPEVSHRAYVLDTVGFQFVVGTDFIVHNLEVKPLSLTQPYNLVVDHLCGREDPPLKRNSK